MRLLSLVVVALLGGCGVTSHNLLLFDAAPSGVSAVKLVIATAEVHVGEAKQDRSDDADDTQYDNDGKWHILSVNRELDLTRHEGIDDAADLGEVALPEGRVTQLRLVLDLSQPQVVTYNDVDCDLDTSRVERSGFKVENEFNTFGTQIGNHHDYYLHFDLRRSLTLNTAGDCFVLTPHLELDKVEIDGVEQSL